MPQDFGTIQCSAKNDVGLQQSPCFFQVVTAGMYYINKKKRKH